MKERYIKLPQIYAHNTFHEKNKEIKVWTLQTHSICCKLTAKIHLSTDNAITIIIARDRLNIHNEKKNIHVSWYEIYIS